LQTIILVEQPADPETLPLGLNQRILGCVYTFSHEETLEQ